MASRPDYCFNRRSVVSGTLSRTATVDWGGTNRLSAIPKSYAHFLVDSSNLPRGRRPRGRSKEAERYALPVSTKDTAAANPSSSLYCLAA
nr:hypothetical protein [Streptomyces sp. DSM 41633]